MFLAAAGDITYRCILKKTKQNTLLLFFSYSNRVVLGGEADRDVRLVRNYIKKC